MEINEKSINAEDVYMKLTDFKKEFDERYDRMSRFDEVKDTDVIITKSSGVPLVLFMRDQEVLEWIKVE